jgi:hypothetical protein
MRQLSDLGRRKLTLEQHPIARIRRNMSSEQEKMPVIKKLTSTSALRTMGVGSSGFAPGSRGIPRCARTTLFGGGSSPDEKNLTALISVFAATYFRISAVTATIYRAHMNDKRWLWKPEIPTSSAVKGSRGCLKVALLMMMGRNNRKVGLRLSGRGQRDSYRF